MIFQGKPQQQTVLLNPEGYAGLPPAPGIYETHEKAFIKHRHVSSLPRVSIHVFIELADRVAVCRSCSQKAIWKLNF